VQAVRVLCQLGARVNEHNRKGFSALYSAARKGQAEVIHHQTVENCQVRGTFWVGGALHEAVSERPPIPLDTIVARTKSFTYAANVWALSIIQGHFLSRRAKP
jgi:hypothetical protein